MPRQKKDDNSTKSEIVAAPFGQTLNLEVRSNLANRTFVPIDRENILKLEKECNFLRRKNNRFLRIVLPDIFLGVATTFLGVVLSGPLGQIGFPDFRAYICYIMAPILALVCAFIFILFKVVYKIRDDNLLRIAEEYILEPVGYNRKEK